MNFLIVEDDNIQLTGLKHIIEEEYADAVVNTASTYNDAITIIDSFDIDIFLLAMILVDDIKVWNGDVGDEDDRCVIVFGNSSEITTYIQSGLSSTEINGQ